jgi:hypothetical protein
MTIEDARKEMHIIKKKLLNLIKISKTYSSTYTKRQLALNEIYRLYRRFLKIYVNFAIREPKFKNNDLLHVSHNCYFYALDFVTPELFLRAINSINTDFLTPVGIMKYTDDEENLNCGKLIENLYQDFDALKMDVYDSEFKSLPKYGGNKIAVYYYDDGFYSDYHFIRQNADGSWSTKFGYLLNPQRCMPKEHLRYGELKYEHIKTLELVKPSQKK